MEKQKVIASIVFGLFFAVMVLILFLYFQERNTANNKVDMMIDLALGELTSDGDTMVELFGPVNAQYGGGQVGALAVHLSGAEIVSRKMSNVNFQLRTKIDFECRVSLKLLKNEKEKEILIALSRHEGGIFIDGIGVNEGEE